MHRRTSTLLATALTGVLLAACGEGSPTSADDGSSVAPATGGDTISVVDDAFEPTHLEVSVGDTITWTWEGRSPHNVVGGDLESDIQQEGTFTHTFEDAGTYDYVCTLHGGMDGTVTVVAG
jgi:plastocyanin